MILYKISVNNVIIELIFAGLLDMFIKNAILKSGCDEMKFSGFENVEVLSSNDISQQRENAVTHTPYEQEVAFLTCIKNGNVESVRAMLDDFIRGKTKIVLGKMSDDSLRQVKYWAVCSIALAARYAIQGGLDETQAFNYSAECINSIDKMSSLPEIFSYLQRECIVLTSLVADSKCNASYPYPIRKCIHYINVNLHTKMTLDMLSKETYLSPDYLSLMFKKNVGISISEYIKKKRLSTAKDMLSMNGKYTASQIAYYLGFCSESYFIKCFKNEYGVTPKQYKASVDI